MQISEKMIEAAARAIVETPPAHGVETHDGKDVITQDYRQTAYAAIEAALSARVQDVAASGGSERDIYEVANQLGSYVGPNTEKGLASFLLREAEEAENLADKIEGLEADLDSAVEVAFNRGATDWVRLNYPSHYARLAAAPAAKQGEAE